MPIKSENRHRYPKGYKWQSIRGTVFSRSKNCCEHCGIQNHFLLNGKRVHLAVAHLDQQPENNELSNLAALCQWCHLKHDQPYRTIHAKITWFKKARAFNLDLFGFDVASIEFDYFRFKKMAFN